MRTSSSPGPGRGTGSSRNVSDPMRSTYACLIMDMVIVSSATQPMPLATKRATRARPLPAPRPWPPARHRGSTPTSRDHQVEPGDGAALPIQNQLVHAGSLEADVAPRALQALGPVVAVGPHGGEIDALQLHARRIDQRHGELVASPGQDHLRQGLERHRAPLKTDQNVLHEKAAVGGADDSGRQHVVADQQAALSMGRLRGKHAGGGRRERAQQKPDGRQHRQGRHNDAFPCHGCHGMEIPPSDSAGVPPAALTKPLGTRMGAPSSRFVAASGTAPSPSAMETMESSAPTAAGASPAHPTTPGPPTIGAPMAASPAAAWTTPVVVKPAACTVATSATARMVPPGQA